VIPQYFRNSPRWIRRAAARASRSGAVVSQYIHAPTAPAARTTRVRIQSRARKAAPHAARLSICHTKMSASTDKNRQVPSAMVPSPAGRRPGDIRAHGAAPVRAAPRRARQSGRRLGAARTAAALVAERRKVGLLDGGGGHGRPSTTGRSAVRGGGRARAPASRAACETRELPSPRSRAHDRQVHLVRQLLGELRVLLEQIEPPRGQQPRGRPDGVLAPSRRHGGRAAGRCAVNSALRECAGTSGAPTYMCVGSFALLRYGTEGAS
jgi:hypothetical protein